MGSVDHCPTPTTIIWQYRIGVGHSFFIRYHHHLFGGGHGRLECVHCPVRRTRKNQKLMQRQDDPVRRRVNLNLMMANSLLEEKKMLILNRTVIYFTKSGHSSAILSAKASSSPGSYYISIWTILVADYI